MNQEDFLQAVEALRDTARLQGNMVTTDQIHEAFEDMSMSDVQMDMIKDYLQKNNIGIDTPIDTDKNLTSEDSSYLQMYLEELKGLPTPTDGEKRAIMMSALAHDVDACASLVQVYLPQVVDIAKLYAGQGALIEDLIGEGNVALMAGSGMLDCVESIDEVEGFLIKMVMDAMEEFISDGNDNAQADEAVLEKVNAVFEKAKELYEDLLRKVTVEEVAYEMNLTADDIIEAIKLSGNNIDYIDYEEDADGN